MCVCVRISVCGVVSCVIRSPGNPCVRGAFCVFLTAPHNRKRSAAILLRSVRYFTGM